MKRTLTLVATVAMMVGAMAGPATADHHDQGPPPEHGHVLLIGVESTGEGEDTEITGFRKCVEIANGQGLPLHVHHESIHQGRAGAALRAAGHVTVPLAPLTEFTGCADFEAMLQ